MGKRYEQYECTYCGKKFELDGKLLDSGLIYARCPVCLDTHIRYLKPTGSRNAFGYPEDTQDEDLESMPDYDDRYLSGD